jgi:hypothetical protein
LSLFFIDFTFDSIQAHPWTAGKIDGIK